LAPDRGDFAKHNVLDLIVVVVPFLRPLRVARSARLLRLLRASYGLVLLARAAKISKRVLTRHKLHYALLITIAAIVGAALMVREFERGAVDSNITSLPDALWWASVTVTTVGMGTAFLPLRGDVGLVSSS
jgi:voltage-gated potassium channel